MTYTQRAAPRPLLGPLIGLTLLFAALGPAIGGLLFAPLALWLAAPPALAAAAHVGWFVALMGHLALLFPAYVIGIAPAAATGFLYALWDHVAPKGWPRVLTAAAIGAVMTHLTGQWIAGLGAGLYDHFSFQISEPQADAWLGQLFSPEFASALSHAFDGCGAAAGLVSALVANAIGLSGAKMLERSPS